MLLFFSTINKQPVIRFVCTHLYNALPKESVPGEAPSSLLHLSAIRQETGALHTHCLSKEPEKEQ